MSFTIKNKTSALITVVLKDGSSISIQPGDVRGPFEHGQWSDDLGVKCSAGHLAVFQMADSEESKQDIENKNPKSSGAPKARSGGGSK